MEGKLYLGVELGSTRIKAVGINDGFQPVISGEYAWKSDYINDIWTYPLEKVWEGLKTALRPFQGAAIQSMGISGMMHGYLVFDKDWNLLVPFRTWQNTITEKASAKLTDALGVNIPQRWSIAHLYQAILNGEDHVRSAAHITTLAGYVHFLLTGVNAVGIGEASGMFPIDSKTRSYDEVMLDKFNSLLSEYSFPWEIRDLLPKVLCAGEYAGALTEAGSQRLGHLLPPGIPFAPCEGDAGTGMVATNSVTPGTCNVSAGTSIFSMMVLDRPLKKIYPEIDIVTTPSGDPVAMIHCNNCTSDINAWVSVFSEALTLFNHDINTPDLYTALFNLSFSGSPDCGGIVVYNYLAGEGITHFDSGCPIVIRDAGSSFTLANFIRAQIYSTMATLRIGMEILKDEEIRIRSITGHGGLFKTPGVSQRYLAAAYNAPVTCMKTAGEGGPYGMALLAVYLMNNTGSLSSFLEENVFADVDAVSLAPDPEIKAGFDSYMDKYIHWLTIERAAVNGKIN